MPVAITSCIRSGLNTFKQLLIPIQLEKSGLACNTALSAYGMINGMAISILLFPGLITNNIASLLIPDFARYNVKKDFTKMNSVINTLFFLVIIFSFFIIGFFLMYSDEISLIAYNDINVGDLIYTSGIGNVTGDLYVGKVKEIRLNNTEIEKNIIVELDYDIDNLNYLFIVS